MHAGCSRALTARAVMLAVWVRLLSVAPPVHSPRAASQVSQAFGGRITGIRLWIVARSSLGVVVRIVKVASASSTPGVQSPANHITGWP